MKTSGGAIAIIVAGGKGLRMGGDLKKQYLRIAGTPILSRTLSVFDRSEYVKHIILVAPKDDHQYCIEKIIEPFQFIHSVHLAEGGTTRQQSVQNGLTYANSNFIPEPDTIVLIHDGVRPFVTDKIISKAVLAATRKKACIPGVKISDTLKLCCNDDFVDKTLDRKQVYAVQTPQAFQFGLLLRAFEHAVKTGFEGTDDAAIVENLGEPVFLIDGSRTNIKLTTPEDLLFAEFLSGKES